MPSAKGLSLVFCLACDLVIRRGHTTIKDQVVTIDFAENWKLTINGTRKEQNGVPPFNVLLECGGMPAAIVGPDGGMTIGGTEAELIRVLKAAGAQMPPDEPEPEPQPDPQQMLPGVPT